MYNGGSQRSRDSIRFRREHKRYLAVHTGKVTEEEYLKSLKEQLYNGVLTLKYGKNLQECVRIALEDGEKALKQGDPFDGIFIVDDMDEHSEEQVRTWCMSLMSSSLPVAQILSKPCIEVWLLCYTGKVNSEAGTIDGARRLARKAGLVGGHHNKHILVPLLNHNEAIKTAKRLRVTYGDDILVCAPTTDMDLLVEKLIDEIKK